MLCRCRVAGAASKSTRTFSDFESVADAMNGICQLYEQRLKQMNPGESFFQPFPPVALQLRGDYSPPPTYVGARDGDHSCAFVSASWAEGLVLFLALVGMKRNELHHFAGFLSPNGQRWGQQCWQKEGRGGI